MTDITGFARGVRSQERTAVHPANFWLEPADILDNPGALQKWQWQPGKLFLGKLGSQFIGISDDRHITTIAGSRSGKSAACITPNLYTYPGSVLVIDPKGELAAETARFRRERLSNEVWVLDPFGASRIPSAAFNPLNLINPATEQGIEYAGQLADTIILQQAGEGAYWTEAARSFLGAALLYVKMAYPDQATLPWLRKLLVAQGDVDSFAELMQQQEGCYGLLKGAGSAFLQKGEKEKQSIISTVVEETKFLDSPSLAETLEDSELDLSAMKKRPVTIYLCLPAMMMHLYRRWLRMVVDSAFMVLEGDTTRPKHPVLFILEEFPTLDYMASIEKAAGLMAGFGVKLWVILQDLGQLRALYKDRWETFLANSGIIQAFGNNDIFTLEYLSKKLGKTRIWDVKSSDVTMSQTARGQSGESGGWTVVELMTPDEIGRYFRRQEDAHGRPFGLQMILSDVRPLALDRVFYFDDAFQHLIGKKA